MNNENDYFNKALSRFAKDFACKDEVLAKYKRGLTIDKIREELLFKISEDEIKEIIDTYEEPDDIVKVTGKLGKISFIKK